MTEINPTPAPVANLRETRKQMAASRKAHPAGKKPAPAKAPAKKASGTSTASTKISWTAEGEKNERGEYPSSTGICGDTEYKITRQADGSFKATVKVGAKAPTVLVADAKSGNAAWKRCVEQSKKGAAA
jgi:hypothetical protein